MRYALVFLFSMFAIACSGDAMHTGDFSSTGFKVINSEIHLDKNAVPVVQGCQEDQYVRRSSDGWVCETVTAVGVSWNDLDDKPPYLDDGMDNDALGALSCMQGQVLAWLDGQWDCLTPDISLFEDAVTDLIIAVDSVQDQIQTIRANPALGELPACGPDAFAAINADAVWSCQDKNRNARKRTVVVSPVLHDPGQSADRLRAALDAITDATATMPYLVIIEAGTYNFFEASDKTALHIKDHLSIRGAGKQHTTITGGADKILQLQNVNNVSIRDLTLHIEKTGDVGAVLVNNAALHMQDVQIAATTLSDNNAYGIQLLAGALVELHNVSIASATTSSGSSNGIFVGAGSLSMTSSTVAAGECTACTAIKTAEHLVDITIKASTLKAYLCIDLLSSDDNSRLSIAHSQLASEFSELSSTGDTIIQCYSVYDLDYVDYVCN